ncbi:MAG: pyruvate dehydrogenase complex dihydrolipoamide acetyltransferase [Opitutaceae bacterium]|nr:pyruvate dehydrogenase complex dihydrolipoamide acetyltransferase [Opitutaceae bacterium]
MANIIEMPKLSDTMTVGTLLKWLKQEGDAVKTGDILAEVETDKATMELESFFDGTLLKIFAPNGSQVALGAPLCAIGKPGEKVDAPAGAPVTASASTPAKGDSGQGTGDRKQEAGDSGQETGGGGQETGDRGQKKPEPAPPDKERAVAATSSKNEVQVQSAAVKTAPASAPVSVEHQRQDAAATSQTGRIKISPLARKLAAEKGIDPSRVTGSGPGGRIVRADILAAENQKPDARSQKSGASDLSLITGHASLLSKGPIQEERTVAVSNMRGAIARRLLESKTQLPHFYVEIEIDAAPIVALREQLNTALEKEGVKLSVNDFVLKAAAEALQRVPQVNASWETAASGQGQIHYFAGAHVSFAVAIEDGLITPVIRDAHQKSIFQISTEAKALGKLAKDKKLKPEQFTGGTFCVSNLGMMGIPRFSAIINPPNAAILAVGTTVKKPVVRNDQIVVGQTMVLTLSCDHRVVDGAVGAQYLGALKQLLEAPALLLI